MRLLCAFLMLASTAPFASSAEWRKHASANFELYTTSGERDARETLEAFEQIRNFFMRIKSSSVTTRLPVTIVGFRSRKEYSPYSVNEFATAYYVGDEQRDFIVMSDLGKEHRRIAVHEYMHLLVRHSGLKMPIWLNEGFAEVYSTMKPVAGQILVGELPPGRTYALANRKWMSLPSLTAVRHGSPEYNEKDRAGIFYAQSWLLTHMLMLHDQYREQFPRFVAHLSATESTEDAFSNIYGKTLKDVEKDLLLYSRSSAFNGMLFKTRFEKVEVGPGKVAASIDVSVTLAKLTALIGKHDEALARFGSLRAEHQNNAEVEEALAHLYWRKNDIESAKQHLARAVEIGASSWKTYWDYARLLSSHEAAMRLRVLQKTVELNPTLLDARLMLGHELYRQRNYADAIQVLGQIRNIDPERAPALFLTMAYSSMELKRNTEAKQWATAARKHARTPSDINACEQLLRYLDHSESARVPVPPLGERARQSEGTASARPSTINGRLQKLDCLDNAARIQMNDGTRTYSLLIRNPAAVAIRNAAGSTVDLTCGEQDTPAVVDYEPHSDPEQGTIGNVVAIEFTK